MVVVVMRGMVEAVRKMVEGVREMVEAVRGWSRLPSSSPYYLSPRQGGGCSTTTIYGELAALVREQLGLAPTQKHIVPCESLCLSV
jgi:hypothetical protein